VEKTVKQRAVVDGLDGSSSTLETRWREVERRDRDHLVEISGFSPAGDRALAFRCLGGRVIVDFEKRRLNIQGEIIENTRDLPVLEMVTLEYLKKVDALYPVGEDIVGCRDLKEGHFFSGVHEFRLGELTERFAKSPESVAAAAMHLGGSSVEMADEAYRLLPFPRVPLYYLMWRGDEEFAPRILVLLDRSIEKVLRADAIWALVNLVSNSMARTA